MEVHRLTEEERRDWEELRLRAEEWFAEEIVQSDLARRLEVSRQAGHAWYKARKTRGVDALCSEGPLRARRESTYCFRLCGSLMRYGRP